LTRAAHSPRLFARGFARRRFLLHETFGTAAAKPKFYAKKGAGSNGLVS
jgi:hypothetical protein